MNERKYLNENMYENGKKKLKQIAIIVLIVGLLIGGSLIFIGVIKTNEIKNNQEAQKIEKNKNARTEKDIQDDIDKLEEQVNQIDSEINNLEMEKNRLQNEKSKIFQEDRGFSDRYYSKDEEVSQKQLEIDNKTKEKDKLETSIDKYDSELWELTSGYNDTKDYIANGRNKIEASKYVPLYFIGGFIILVSCGIALWLFIFSKRREIVAFTTQQVMPVAKEGIDEMAPTIGNAVGEIAKGIKNGLKEEDSDKNNE